METYVALLRGINVSGQKMIKMQVLQSLFAELGFKNIRTYIQSGNIIFESGKISQDVLAKQIEEKILQSYHFEVPAIIRHHDEIKRILENNPFLIKRNEDINKLYVTFLSNESDESDKYDKSDKSIDYDEFIISGKNIYLFCPNGYGRTKLNNNFFESKLKVKATTRNWKTVNALL
jgi:uncharacterized protein (DUF1697 family)